MRAPGDASKASGSWCVESGLQRGLCRAAVARARLHAGARPGDRDDSTLAAIATVGISPAEACNASGPFNMLRNLGGAIGTSTLEAFVTKREDCHSIIINADV
jgi:hypothetical protein